METGIPVSKRALFSGGGILAILELNKSTSEYVLYAMGFVTFLAVAYMIADEVKRRRNGTD